MPDYKLPEAAWPLQYRHADRGMFTTTSRDPSPFEAKDLYGRTLGELHTELQHLKAREAHLQLVLGGGEADLRMDGQLKVRADVRSPGVALTVVSAEHGTLVYTCDAFDSRWSNAPPSWQINLRAITIGLKDLRRVARYGIADRGQQYAGFRELGTGTAMGGATQSRTDVARYLATMAGMDDLDPDDPGQILVAYRLASKRNHPDVGGSSAQQAYINAARDHLLGTTA